MRIGLFFYFFAFLQILLKAQSSENLLRFGYQASHLIVHSPNFKIKPIGTGNTIDFFISRTTSGSESWHSELGFLRYGLLCKYLDLGAPNYSLGNAIGISPFYDFVIKKKPTINYYFLLGTGFTYNFKIFDIKNNPSQNAISTHWNNLTYFEFRFESKISKRWNIYSGLAMLHISNGSFKSPNLGLNYFNIILGINQMNKKNHVLSTNPIPEYKKWMIALNYGIAIKEHKIYGGPKFKVQMLSMESGINYRRFRIIKVGLDVEQNQLSAYFASNVDLSPSIKAAFEYSLKVHAFAGHEWLIGSTSLETRIGYQIRRKTVIPGYPLTTKFIFQYHLPIKSIPNIRISTGISLKAQFGDAEYLNGIIGIRYKF